MEVAGINHLTSYISRKYVYLIIISWYVIKKNKSFFFAANRWLWPILPHLWANTNKPTELFRYLDRMIETSPLPSARSPLFSAMAQTTPTVLDILFLRGSIRENANDVNRNVTARLISRWRQNANIVSSDFFLGNDVIDVSIMLSVERSNRLWQIGRLRSGGIVVNKQQPVKTWGRRSPGFKLTEHHRTRYKTLRRLHLLNQLV